MVEKDAKISPQQAEDLGWLKQGQWLITTSCPAYLRLVSYSHIWLLADRKTKSASKPQEATPSIRRALCFA